MKDELERKEIGPGEQLDDTSKVQVRVNKDVN